MGQLRLFEEIPLSAAFNAENGWVTVQRVRLRSRTLARDGSRNRPSAVICQVNCFRAGGRAETPTFSVAGSPTALLFLVRGQIPVAWRPTNYYAMRLWQLSITFNVADSTPAVLRREVARNIKNELRRVGRECVDRAVCAGHDRHV